MFHDVTTAIAVVTSQAGPRIWDELSKRKYPGDQRKALDR